MFTNTSSEVRAFWPFLAWPVFKKFQFLKIFGTGRPNSEASRVQALVKTLDLPPQVTSFGPDLVRS